MSQAPSSIQAIDLVKKFKGLNDQQDSVARPPGSVTSDNNIIDIAGGDASRRQGRDMVSLDDGNAVQIILDLPWDDGGVATITLSGTGMSYDDFTYPSNGSGGGTTTGVTDPATPGPMPNEPGFIPWMQDAGIPDYTSYMRALSEARMYVNHGVDDLAWNARVYDAAMYDSNGALLGYSADKSDIMSCINSGGKVRQHSHLVAAPTPGTSIPNNFYWCDYYFNRAYIVTDLNTIKSFYNTLLLNFAKTYPVDGQATVSLYTADDQFSETATWKNHVAFSQRLAGAINTKLVRVFA